MCMSRDICDLRVTPEVRKWLQTFVQLAISVLMLMELTHRSCKRCLAIYLLDRRVAVSPRFLFSPE